MAHDKRFYVEMGARIAQLRKSADLTQQQLADILGIGQQTLAHYEVGRLRVAVAMLPSLAKALGASIEELIGEEPKPGKRGPTPKLMQQLERIGQLPKPQQRVLIQMIDGVLAQASR